MRTHIARLRANLLRPLQTPDELDRWIRLYTGLRIPTHAVCTGHASPFDYIRHAYFEPATDVVVWAPRGGGKTRLAALATLLDLLHKPGCSVRILGGSLEQSLRMWEHLLPDVSRLAEDLFAGKPRASRRLTLKSGSTAAVLTQSQRAVRGLRVQKLRCDEVELFDPDVWEAAQLVTRSKINRGSGIGDRGSGEMQNPKPDTRSPTPDLRISGAIEAISTFHTPHGLMQRVIENAEKNKTKIIRWCILDVLERCPPERSCQSCSLHPECGGVAKEKCDGFVSIDDAIAMKRRVSQEMWEAEMLCRRPSLRGSVFPSFDPAMHGRESIDSSEDGVELSLALDFGFAAPFVCLWIRSFGDGVTYVIDEYVQPMRTVPEHLEHIKSRKHGETNRIACDPAGAGRNEQTAASNVTLLRQAGYIVRYRKSGIPEGLEMVRAALQPADGPAKLFIHPRCKHLIRAMQCYRYPEGGGEIPIKDGEHDHLIDALRYHFVNRPTTSKPVPRRY